jgi:hypothetical protein
VLINTPVLVQRHKYCDVAYAIITRIQDQSEQLIRLKSDLVNLREHRELAGATHDVVEIERHILQQQTEVEAALMRVHDLSKHCH